MSEQLKPRQRLIEAMTDHSTDPARRWIGRLGFAIETQQLMGRVERVGSNVIVAPVGTDLDVSFLDSSENNLVVIRDVERSNRRPMLITGNDNVVYVGDTRKYGAKIGINGDGNFVFIGEDATTNDVNIVLKCSNRSLIIGEDCMFSQGISIRVGDSHALFEVENSTLFNAPDSIVFHPHVWVSEDSIVMKGVEIGPGSAIGAGSIVARSIGAMSLAVGGPARVIKEGVTWSRAHHPDEREMARIARWLEPFIASYDAHAEVQAAER